MAGITYYTYNRDTSKDIIVTQNSSTQSSGYLTDGNGNILMINGKAIYVTLETPIEVTFNPNNTITSYSIDGTSYTGTQTISLLEGNHVLVCIGQHHVYINNTGTYKEQGSNIPFTLDSNNAVFSGDGVTITCNISNSIILSSVNEPN